MDKIVEEFFSSFDKNPEVEYYPQTSIRKFNKDVDYHDGSVLNCITFTSFDAD